jgi:hypothetical protein
MRRALAQIEIPGEHDARERTWGLLSAAFVEREPAVRRRSRRLIPALAVATIAAVAAAAASSPGRAVLNRIREAVGVEKAEPALFSLPTGGRLLVSSQAGVWVVQPDGSKRLLGRYAEASWSPHGRYVVAARRNALYALTPDGAERWSLARPQVRSPRWTGTDTDTRIAYTSRDELRVVAGDGRGDTSLGRAPGLVDAPLAWRPGTRRQLAYALVAQRVIRVVDVDADGAEVWSRRIPAGVRKLEWSPDGRYLLAFAPAGLRVYNASGAVVARDDPSDATHDADATFVPGTNQVVVIRVHGEGSTLFVLHGGRTLFNVAGTLDEIVASPDGRWLLVGWPEADQWIFVRASGRRILAVSHIKAQFRTQSFPRVEGWCCPG